MNRRNFLRKAMRFAGALAAMPIVLNDNSKMASVQSGGPHNHDDYVSMQSPGNSELMDVKVQVASDKSPQDWIDAIKVKDISDYRFIRLVVSRGAPPGCSG